LTILKAIGLGQTRYSELLNATGLANNELPIYLKTLIEVRLVKKEIPITEDVPEKSKKGNYSLTDNFFRFYFSYVFPNASLVESRAFPALFEKNKELLVKLIAKSYEETTAEFVRTAIQTGALPPLYRLGRWWDKNTEIDLVGLNDENNSILFVETKWNTKPLRTEVLDDLKQKAEQVVWGRPNRKEYFALIAKCGFSGELLARAKAEAVVLIQEDKIVE
jgi:hypothetical protein